MVSYYCCGCRASYPAQPKRCPRCKGRSFSAVSDDAPTRGLLDAEPAAVAPADMSPDLAEAFAASERFRLEAMGQRVRPNVIVLEGDDAAPATPRDLPPR